MNPSDRPRVNRRVVRTACLALLTCGLFFVLPAVFCLAQKPAAGSGATSAGGASKEHETPPENERKLQALLETAKQSLDRDDYPAAVQALKSAVEIDPGLFRAWFNLGYAYSGLHQNERAVAAYQKTIELQPNLYQARLNLGMLLLDMKQPVKALEQLKQAAALAPSNATAHLDEARALAATGQPDAARKEISEAARLNPHSVGPPLELGRLELDAENFEEARSAFKQAAALNPKLPQAALGLALADEGLQDDAQAAQDLERYLALKPDDLEARFRLAKIDVALKKYDPALEQLDWLENKNAALPGLAVELGYVNAMLKRLPLAEKYYRQALQASLDQANLHCALGQTLLQEKKLAKAEAEFRTALRLDPQSPEGQEGLSTALYLKGHYTDAIPMLEALLARPNPPVDYFFILATCYIHLHQLKKARRNYQQFLAGSRGENPDQEWQARQWLKVIRNELGK
jgi:tetratricopeptide (TPR) repeat protein